MKLLPRAKTSFLSYCIYTSPCAELKLNADRFCVRVARVISCSIDLMSLERKPGTEPMPMVYSLPRHLKTLSDFSRLALTSSASLKAFINYGSVVVQRNAQNNLGSARACHLKLFRSSPLWAQARARIQLPRVKSIQARRARVISIKNSIKRLALEHSETRGAIKCLKCAPARHLE